MIETMLMLVGLAGTGTFLPLWLKEKRKSGHGKKGSSAVKSAPQSDDGDTFNLRLLEIAALGYDEAVDAMDKNLKPYLRSMLNALRSEEKPSRWHTYQRANAILSETDINTVYESHARNVEVWADICRARIGEGGHFALEPLSRLSDQGRKSLFGKICNCETRLVRLSNGDRTALSLEPDDFVAYLRHLKISEEKIIEELKGHVAIRAYASAVDDALLQFRAMGTIRNRMDGALGEDIAYLRASVDTLPEPMRSEARDRLQTMERRTLLLQHRQATERVRLKLDEAEVVADADAEVAKILEEGSSS